MVIKRSQRTMEARLPPSRQGLSKPLVIGIIAVVAILALSSLLLFSNVFVGKAISFQALNVGEAGFAIDQQVNTLTVGKSELFPVNINLGDKKSSVVSFELNYNPQAVSPDCSNIYKALDSIFIGNNFNLAVIKKSTCENGKITFTYGALADKDHLITGKQTLAEITFTALNSPGQASLLFTPNSFKVYDLESVEPKLIGLQIKDGTIQVEQPQGVQGIKIILTDVAPANDVFSTKITATEGFDNEVTIYTTLYDAADKVLALKLEKLTGLAKGQTYTATMNYPEAKVKKKSVIVYDVKQNPTVFGSLEVVI